MILSCVLYFLATFAAAMIIAPSLLSTLRSLKFGKQIRADGPASHMSKAGTPTMGGLIFIFPPLIAAAAGIGEWPLVLAVAVALLGFGGYGAFDDFANMRSVKGLGLRVRFKFIWHTLIALAISLILFFWGGVEYVRLPGGLVLDIGWWMVPLGALVIFSTTSAVNETDGLDGLAGGVCSLILATIALLSLMFGEWDGAYAAMAVLGSLVAFLWYNVHPAKVFMGDTGSLALGAVIATLLLHNGWFLLLFVMGVVMVIEVVSVIAQVAYFRYSKGKRLFRMSPFHHHLELGGWPEVKITQRFWLLTAVGCVISVGLATIGMGG